MPKYSPEKKAEALARMAEIGVQKTSEELNTSLQTLYKWRNEGNEAAVPAQNGANTDELRQMLINDEPLEEKLRKSDEENKALRDENRKLREKLAQMKKAVIALME